MPSKELNVKKKTPIGITNIYVRGFKSISGGCSIEIRPLTILAGANSSGKSSIMQPLLMMKQTLEATYDPGPLLIDGPHVRFTSIAQFLSKDNTQGVNELEIGFEIDGNISVTEKFKQIKKNIQIYNLKYVDKTREDNAQEVVLRPEMKHNEIISANPVFRDYWRYFEDNFKDKSSKDQLELNAKFELNVRRVRCFLESGLSPLERRINDQVFIPTPLFNNEPFEIHVRKLIHVPALRGNPERTYKTTPVGSMFSGTFEHYVASIISHWQTNKDPRLKELGLILETLGLTWRVYAKQVDDTRVELRVGRLPARKRARDLVSIADVGFGVSQSLPILVALLVAERGQLVYIEQPEIHLHPRAQAAMAQVLVDAAKRGVRVVIETHSELLLLGIQTLVAEGRIPPEMAKLHWFERQEDGITKVSSSNLDEAGAFGDWPEDFANVELDAESRYLDAVESRLGAD